MEGQPQPGDRRVLKRPPEHRSPLDRAAVVREGGRAGLGQRAHLGQALSLLAGGDRGHEPGRHARLAARALDQPREDDGVSTTGWVFGIARIAVKPPAAAARVPDPMSSSSSSPGVRRWTCGSTRPGRSTRPSASIVSSSVPGEVGPDLGDHALVDADVERVAVEPRDGIDDAGAGDQDVGGRVRRRRRAGPSRHLLARGGDDVGRDDRARPRSRPCRGRRGGRRARPSGPRAPPAPGR